jgi:hypothetical protein
MIKWHESLYISMYKEKGEVQVLIFEFYVMCFDT